MKELLTPKQVARAIDVSESSVKRWCDKGVIPTQYTAGGHRRITISGVLEFLRGGRHKLLHPEALGLPPTSGQTNWVMRRAREALVEALVAGDETVCRQIAFDLYLANHTISRICDDAIAAAFRDIGEQWACGDAEVYQERRGCEITLRILHELRAMLPPPPADAPRAIGCAASGDQYSLGTTMAELVLRNASWNATSLGDNLPFETVAAAIRDQRPKLFWLSCSHIADVSEFLDGYRQLVNQNRAAVEFVGGGFALTDAIRNEMPSTEFCETMQELDTFARSRGAPRQPAD